MLSYIHVNNWIFLIKLAIQRSCFRSLQRSRIVTVSLPNGSSEFLMDVIHLDTEHMSDVHHNFLLF